MYFRSICIWRRFSFTLACYPFKYYCNVSFLFTRLWYLRFWHPHHTLPSFHLTFNINVVSSVQTSTLRDRCKRLQNCHVAWVRGLWRGGKERGQVRRETFLSYSWIRLIGFCTYRAISFSRFLSHGQAGNQC